MVGAHHEAEEEDDERWERVHGEVVCLGWCPWFVAELHAAGGRRWEEDARVEQVSDSPGLD